MFLDVSECLVHFHEKDATAGEPMEMMKNRKNFDILLISPVFYHPWRGKKLVRGEKTFVFENIVTELHFALSLMFISFLEQKERSFFETSKNPHLSALESGFDPDVSNLQNLEISSLKDPFWRGISSCQPRNFYCR